MEAAKALEVLAEFNRWRRGQGPYSWDEEPSRNRPLPYTPAEIGTAIDRGCESLGREAAGKCPS